MVYPDLAPTVFSVPATGRGGSALPLSWTVTNAGAATGATSWTDRVVLSTDAVLGNADDVVLGSLVHDGALAPARATPPP